MKRLIYIILIILTASCTIDEVDDNPVYLSNNGITIMAKDWAPVGAIGIIDGVTYTVVNETMLREILREMLINDDLDIATLVTTKVTDMSLMFSIQGPSQANIFNQPIGNWDTSNVITMRDMFYLSTFNQDISSWDVSSVTDMRSMFNRAISFNQDLSIWNINNVILCSNFNFNTPLWVLPQPNFTNCN
jgi:surface protein